MDKPTGHRDSMTKHSLTFLTLALMWCMPLGVSAAPADWVIRPAKHAGPITHDTTEQDLIRLYGKDNVKRVDVYIGEGETLPGTVLFPDTPKELTIEWGGLYVAPSRLTITRRDSVWKIDKGIKVGDTLERVEKLNRKAFRLTGFEWDYPGRTVSWEHGKLPVQLQLDFDFDVDMPLPPEEYTKVLGDGDFSSRNPTIRKLKLKVERIFIRWDL